MSSLLKSPLINNEVKINSANGELQEKIWTLSRLKWACRRGMLELDLLLSRFLETAYDNLSEHGKTLFINLLSEEDTVLYAWLMNREQPLQEYQSLIEKIIQSY